MVLFKKINNKDGFTLIEILIALVVFVVGSVSIWSLFAAAINTYNESLDYQAATLAAETIIEELEGGSYKTIDFGKDKILKPIYEGKIDHFPGYNYQLKWVEMENDAVLIKLKIFYQRRGQQREFEFRTVIYRKISILE